MNARRTTASRPWWKNWKIWAGVFAVAAVGSALTGGGEDAAQAPAETTATAEATASAEATVDATPDEIEQAIADAREVCGGSTQYANGWGFADRSRDLGPVEMTVEPEQLASPLTARQLMQEINPNWETADNGNWLPRWLEARGLTGSEKIVSVPVKTAEGTIFDCFVFVGAHRADGSPVSWTEPRSN